MTSGFCRMSKRVSCVRVLMRRFSARCPKSLRVYRYRSDPKTGRSMMTISHVSFAEGSVLLLMRITIISRLKNIAEPKMCGINVANQRKRPKSITN